MAKPKSSAKDEMIIARDDAKLVVHGASCVPEIDDLNGSPGAFR